ncbi:MAG TPA: hypothetical protein ENK47_00205 [Euryarchaeota archaeon]|nr:hypothetical protein [Euryarchaeota archaeon]
MTGILGMSAGVAAALGAAGLGLGTALSVYGVRKLIQIGQFSYHNSRLSTLGNPYVRRDEVLPLLEMDSPVTLAKSLNTDLETGDNLSEFREVDRALYSSLHERMEDLRRDSPSSLRPIVEAYLCRFEGEELKRLMRLIGNRSEPLFPVGWLDSDVERTILAAENIPSALEVLEGQPVSGRISEVIKGENGPTLASIDDAIDRYVLDEIRETRMMSFSSRRGLSTFFDMLCDRYNIHLAVRSLLKNEISEPEPPPMIYSSGGTLAPSVMEQIFDAAGLREAISILSSTHMGPHFKDLDTSDPYSFEVALDRMLLQGAVSLSYAFSSTVGPTIRYMVSKEMEQKNLRTLFFALIYGWDAEWTKARLVLEEGP